uniref:Uncharacterized protein n=1 Tax=Manihot esculenta TaxID=3983 RepID=A0A2C9WJ90_MANES
MGQLGGALEPKKILQPQVHEMSCIAAILSIVNLPLLLQHI